MTDPDGAALEAGRRLFAGSCDFELSVVSLRDLPAPAAPEVAFAGRSNVGKSSLINALTNRKGLARASAEPGRTRALNYFDLGRRLRLVDLPGYGYARASKKESAAWRGLTRDYLRGRAELARVCLLIDARHGLKPNDAETQDLFDEAAVVYQLVLTKIDKLKADEARRRLDECAAAIAKRPAAHPHVIATSSAKGDGLGELRAELAALAAPRPMA
ncbi:MAG: ribosome biogenesis GTP-binding protein YihA/YsxC [Pseudomonadota bacterium]